MKRWVLILIGVSWITIPFFSYAEGKPVPQEQMVSFPDFRTVAKESIPAVVFVRVEAKPRMPSGHSFSPGDFGGSASEDPFEMFGRDFFDRFFGMPRREQQSPSPVIGQASGFIVSPDGYILTNNHVVSEADVITILMNDGREYQAEVVGADKNSDLAVLKIDASEELPFLTLGNSDDLEVGQWVCAIGNPLGLQASLSVGVVSAKGRNNLDLVQYEDFIQTDTMINRGNSGGPLMTLDGEVIGINTAIATSGASPGFMGIGFAIPSNMAEKVMEQLIRQGTVTRGFLGIVLQNIDHSLAQSFHLDRVEGALVVDVKADSPAAKAGLLREDIILAYDGKPVTNISSFRNAISFMHPGTQVRLSVLRNEGKMDIPVELGSFGDTETKESLKRKEELGIEVDALTSEQAQQLGYANEGGLLITKVYPSSIAAKVGIRKGALLLSVNRKPLSSVQEFQQLINSHDPSKPLLLLIKQGEAVRYVTVKLK